MAALQTPGVNGDGGSGARTTSLILRIILPGTMYDVKRRDNLFQVSKPYMTAPTEDCINTLPVELFLPCFQAVLWDQYSNRFQRPDYYDRLWYLRRVCGRWKDIVDTSPPLWTFVDLGDPPAVIDMAFMNSRDRPLTVDWITDWEEETTDKRAKLIPHLGRIKTLKISPRSPITLFQNPAPLLENLYIRKERNAVDIEVDHLFGGVAPRLAYVIISKAQITLKQSVFSNIQTLALYTYGHLSPLDLLDALRFFPTLTSLTFEEIYSKMFPRRRHVHVVSLPHLHTLRLVSSDDTSILPQIVRYIYAPQCRDTTFDFYHVVPDMLDPVIEHLIIAATRGGRQMPGSEGWALELREETEPRMVLRDATLYLPRSCCKAFPSLVRQLKLQTADFISGLVLDGLAMARFFHDDWCARSIEVANITLVVSTALEDRRLFNQGLWYLGLETGFGWRFPMMQTLWIQANNLTSGDLADVAKMVKRRLPCPVALQAILLELEEEPQDDGWDNVMEELRCIVPEVDGIVWLVDKSAPVGLFLCL